MFAIMANSCHATRDSCNSLVVLWRTMEGQAGSTEARARGEDDRQQRVIEHGADNVKSLKKMLAITPIYRFGQGCQGVPVAGKELRTDGLDRFGPPEGQQPYILYEDGYLLLLLLEASPVLS